MGQRDRGWEDIRKQDAYKKGEAARDLAENENTTEEFVRDYVRENYKKMNKVERENFRHGYNKR